MVVCDREPADNLHQAAIWANDAEICVKFRSRKNMQNGSGVLKRGCTCPGIPSICPVHELWDKLLCDTQRGTCAWAGTTAAAALRDIRAILRKMNVRISSSCAVALHQRVHLSYRSMAMRPSAPTHSEGDTRRRDSCARLFPGNITIPARVSGYDGSWRPAFADPEGRTVAKRSLFTLHG